MTQVLKELIADFTTSLSAKIAVGGETGTIQSILDDDGETLPNGEYCFTIDADNSQKEHIVCTLTGSTLSAIKSVSRQGVETTGVAREHRLGASVAITDFSHIYLHNELLKGDKGFDSTAPLKYDAIPVFSNDEELISKSYADAISASGLTSMLVVDAGGITVNVSAGTYILNGTIKEYAGASAQALTDDDTNYIQILDGVLDINITGFADDAIPLAEAVCASTDISSLTDKRPFYTGVDIKANNGLGRDATGIYVDLATDPGLEFSSGELQVKIDPSGGLSKSSTGVKFNGLIFGGDGSDGALDVTSGTTTLDAAGAAVLIKNYTSINISSGATLTIENPHAGGTLLILKSAGNVTIAGTVDLDGMGANSATNSAYNLDETDNKGGTGGNGSYNTGGAAGAAGTIYTNKFLYSLPDEFRLYSKAIFLTCGAGGGAGGSTWTESGTFGGGAGGRGGGALTVECVGALDYSGAINISGTAGVKGTSATTVSGDRRCGGAGGGGGSAGMALVLYNSLTANTGTITAGGGDGGDGGDGIGTQTWGSFDGGSIGSGGSGGGAACYSFAGVIGIAGVSGGSPTAGNNAVGIGAGGSGGTGGVTPNEASTQSGGAGGAGSASDSSLYLITQNLWF